MRTNKHRRKIHQQVAVNISHDAANREAGLLPDHTSSPSPADVISRRHQSKSKILLNFSDADDWHFDPAVWVSSLVAVVLFLNTLDAGFVYDDRCIFYIHAFFFSKNKQLIRDILIAYFLTVCEIAFVAD